LHLNKKTEGTISFLNLAGKLISKERIVNVKNEYYLATTGMILYQLNPEKGTIKTGKILVQ